jgi:hypothetical protein
MAKKADEKETQFAQTIENIWHDTGIRIRTTCGVAPTAFVDTGG